MNNKNYILAIDQGTTGSRALLLNKNGKEVGRGYCEIKQYYPKPGWVEHDPYDILISVQDSIRKALKASRINPLRIASIGITNQRESVLLWNRKTSRPCGKVIVWQDRRTADFCQKLRGMGYEKIIHSKTGLIIDPYFSGSKLSWIFQHYPNVLRDAKKKLIVFGTMDSWLLWNMTGEHITDHTNASRTLLYDISNRKWDAKLLNLFSVPEHILPRIQNSASPFGKTKNWKGLPDGIPVTAICGDQQAALYGQGCYSRGEMKNTYGTGLFLVINTGQTRIISKSGMLSTIACDQYGKPAFALEGSVFMAGAIVQWIRDALGWINSAGETEKIAQSVPDSHGVTVIPAFVGLGAPYWDANARGAILGLTRGVRKEHIIRACLESIAFQTADLVQSIKKEFKFPLSSLKVDGGATDNDFLMKFQSDITGLKVLRSHRAESTAWGVGKMAGISCGLWSSPKKLDRQIQYDTFLPGMNETVRKTLIKHWKEQIRRVLTDSHGK